jgi:SEC-C motif
VRGGADDDLSVELIEKLGRNDPCPCGSGKRFQGMLSERRPVSTGPGGMTIGGEWGAPLPPIAIG